MNMVGVAANFYNRTVKFIVDTILIGVLFWFCWWLGNGFTVLGAEYEVNIILYE